MTSGRDDIGTVNPAGDWSRLRHLLAEIQGLDRVESPDHLLRQLKILAALFDHSRTGIVIESPEGVILDANPAYCEFMGFAREELVGHNITVVVPEDLHPTVPANIARVLAGETLHHVARSIDHDGRPRDLELLETRIPPDGREGLIVLVNDVTDRRRADQLHEQVVRRNIELARTVEQLHAREGLLAQQLDLARQVQQRFLPHEFPFPERLDTAAVYRAHASIGGDLFDLFALGPDMLGFLVADVSGHGVSAALVTALLKVNIDRLREQLRTAPRTARALAEATAQLNDALVTSIPEETFVSLLLGTLDLETGDLTLSNAGHEPPILHRPEAGAEFLVLPPNIAAGILADQDFVPVRTHLAPGELLFLYTDGLPESHDRMGREWGPEALRAFVGRQAGEGPGSLLEALERAIDDFTSHSGPQDDYTAVALRRR
jgi:PAS domain S-box-containing protein